MNPLIQKLVSIAQSQVGVKEEGGNNRGKHIVDYQAATWLEPGPWAWCAALQCWVLREWLKDAEVQKHLGLNALTAQNWRCKDASAFGWIKWAEKRGLYVTDEKEEAKAGDFVVFDFSHIGIVVEDQLPGKQYIVTVEGNTNGKGERDSESGDGVWTKNRSTNLVRAYIRIVH